MEKLQIKEIEILKNFDDVLTFKEFRQVLKIGRNKAYELLQKNIVSSIRIGNSYRIPKVNIIKYLKNQ